MTASTKAAIVNPATQYPLGARPIAHDFIATPEGTAALHSQSKQALCRKAYPGAQAVVAYHVTCRGSPRKALPHLPAPAVQAPLSHHRLHYKDCVQNQPLYGDLLAPTAMPYRCLSHTRDHPAPALLGHPQPVQQTTGCVPSQRVLAGCCGLLRNSTFRHSITEQNKKSPCFVARAFA